MYKLNLDNNVELLGIQLFDEGRNPEGNLEVVGDAIVEHNKLTVRWPERDRLVQLEGVVAHALMEVDVLNSNTPVS